MAMTRALLISISDRFISEIPAPKKGFAFIPIGLKEELKKKRNEEGGRAGPGAVPIIFVGLIVKMSVRLSLSGYIAEGCSLLYSLSCL